MKSIKYVIILGIILGFVFTFHSALAEQRIEPSYVNVQIFDGDSLWSIAAAHPHDGISMQNYIQEIKDINGIKSDRIHAGRHLIVPIYQAP